MNLLAGMLLSVAFAQNGAVEVDPATHVNRRDLIGKEIIIDDRKRMVLPHPTSLRYHEILLRSTPVVVRLPVAFQFRTAPSAQSVRVRGILRQEGKTLICDATAKPELFASDRKRLEAEVANLAPNDLTNRSAWANWAERRGKAFEDEGLKEEAVKLYTEVIALELARADSRTPEAIVALAQKARQHHVEEPEPSALWHLGFRLKMTAARTAADYDAIARDVSTSLPQSMIPAPPPSNAALYDDDPLNGYRRASEADRRALDRRLWADCVTQSLKLRVAADPAKVAGFAVEARTQLPDRPELAAELRKRDLDTAGANVARLRRTEMLDLEKTYREELKQPAKARELVVAWLDARKTALRPTSADAHTDLAKEYLALLKDRATATDLLNKALEIDPNSQEASDQFQRLGFVKSNGVWTDPQATAAKPANDAPATPAERDVDSYLGLTPAEIRAQLGEPKRVSRLATQGRVSLQWVYDSGKGTQSIDFLQKIGESQPTVVGRFVSK